jgi:predicted metal-dependent hydrolase
MLKALWSVDQPRKQPEIQLLEVDDQTILWRRSARRTRSLTLKIDKQGQVIAMTPMATSLTELQQFVRARKVWLQRQIGQFEVLQARQSEANDRFLWYRGEKLLIETCTEVTASIEIEPGLIRIGSRRMLSATARGKRLNSWLRERAELDFSPRLEHLSRRTQLRGSGLQIKNYTARWGSCRHNGLIQLNWKLIKTPPEVIDYVIIHELCHLQHFNHSADFWALVTQHCPLHKHPRQWLKNHGRLLLAN